MIHGIRSVGLAGRRGIVPAMAMGLLMFCGLAIVASSPSAAGVTVSNYTNPGIFGPWGITAGPDGALWFTNSSNRIGRITTSGAVSTFTGPDISDPTGITAGPDGALWFTNFENNSIGRITTAGKVTNYTIPSTGSR